MRLKEEYSQAVVENMSEREARAYLRQIIYNDVAVEDGLALSKKICKVFGDKVYDQICLLYTSPSPRDATLSRMPSSA